MVNPFNGVSREEYNELAKSLATANRARGDAQREASGLRIQLKEEIENAERLTALAARAIQSSEIYRLALIERQIGAQRDPSMVLVVNSLPAAKKHSGFVPLKKRRRDAARKEEAETLRRTALPKLTADLPPVPLTAADRDAMREVMTELSKETI